MNFTVDLVSCTNNNGDWRIFGSDIPVLFEKKRGTLTELSSDLLTVVFSNLAVSVALADFREAMRLPMQTGFFCYRAVEAMMQTMKASPNDKDGPAWFKLRSDLRVDKSAIDYIKEHADWARHGKTGNISDSQRATIFVLADQIIGRYIDYLLGGGVSLEGVEVIRAP